MSDFLHSQSDYLIFLAGALAFFAALARLLPQSRPGLRMSRLTWPVVGLVLTVGWFPVQRAGDTEREQTEALVSALAPTYAYELEHAGHWRITTGTPTDDPVYQHVLELERAWLNRNSAAHDIYTMRRGADGRHIFIADTDTDYNQDGQIDESERGAAIGDVRDGEDEGLDKALDGHANFDTKIVRTKWGARVGAWAPIFDPLGKVEAVVGIDYDAHDWLDGIADARRDRIVELALILLTVAAAMAAVGAMEARIDRLRAEAASTRPVEALPQD